MPLGTLDGTPPPFFRQGPSALSKLTFFSALALFLMVADVRLQLARPVREVVATALYPLQWLALRPVLWTQAGGQYFESLASAQASEEAARQKLALQSQRANQIEHLIQENKRLRQLLDLRERLTTPGQAAQILYDAADPYSRKVIIDRGALKGVLAGSPVIDEAGVLGQVTRVYPMTSEVTLVTDRDQAIPVLNTRTGVRGVAFGDSAMRSNAMELRFMAADEDVQAGDLLTTSGVDGVYPPGLPVATVTKVDHRVDPAFARISCEPLALVLAAHHVMVLQPLVDPRPGADTRPVAGRKGARK